MKAMRSLSLLLGTAWLGLAPSLCAAIRLAPVIADGLASPVFVGNAGDGSDRLFVVEQSGMIRVLQPGASTPTVFLDVGANIAFGGEQGLLGLAFHPQYRSNGRFFIYYTDPEGTLVVAERHVSAADPNVADPAEKVLLMIPHPINQNHNGGMLAFGPDGYLYIGVGDGGAGNDPPDNAQNIEVLLGKILRIDVDPPAGSGLPYVAPPTNPFTGTGPGRAEIFAFGLRNPWRFSFDRGGSHAQWVGDVGQDAHEEVDTPIVGGGNYGWRVFEGFSCTGNDPALCDPADYRFPVLDYDHSNGRCSITGGYVYRGLRGALASGTYVYADFCSGELFAWNGSAQSLLLETGQNISSFGEDEAGEIYVVNINGSVSRIETDDASIATAVEYYYAPWDHYFVTAFPSEIDLLDGGAYGGLWQRTGQTFRVWAQAVFGALPACRFFGTDFAPKSTHFYTPYPAECALVRDNPDWVYESDAFYLQLPDAVGGCPPATTPLFRLYNAGMGGAPNHRYTTSADVFNRMQAAGWIFEGDILTQAFACVPQ